MFDSYSRSTNSQSVKINAVSGAILKNHPKSWFQRFHLQSEMAEKLLVEGGHKARKSKSVESEYSWRRGEYHTVWEDDPDNDIIVLQMVICGDMEVIAECVHRSDYEFVQGDENSLAAGNIELVGNSE